ncbi:MAG: hypothetical protein ACTSXK_03875 [Promethearchaeota archaeon]
MELKTISIGALISMISGILLLISEFLPWIGDYNAIDLLKISVFDSNQLIYIFPIFAGSIIIIISVFLLYPAKKKKSIFIIYLLLLILCFNLEIFFFSEIFSAHGTYVWQHPGIYFNILGLVGALIGLLYLYFKRS